MLLCLTEHFFRDYFGRDNHLPPLNLQIHAFLSNAFPTCTEAYCLLYCYVFFHSCVYAPLSIIFSELVYIKLAIVVDIIICHNIVCPVEDVNEGGCDDIPEPAEQSETTREQVPLLIHFTFQ